MLGLQLLFASVATTANIVFTVWAVKVDRPHDGFGTLYEGECNISARLNTAAHVVLNILASLFLGAGNFCMQVLVAPTPEEVREQHARNESFDIGTHSLQNLRNIHSRRRLLWIGLGLISTLLHLVLVLCLLYRPALTDGIISQMEFRDLPVHTIHSIPCGCSDRRLPCVR
jgi:hypothetical protein